MSYLIAILILAAFVRITLRFWDRHDLDDSRFNRRQFLLWLAKGLVQPVIVWMLANAAISSRYPPLLSHVGLAAKAGGAKWLSAWLALVLPTVFVVSSYWAAATFLWLVTLHVLE